MDVLLEAKSPTGGVLTSSKGGFEADVTIQQDFPIAHEPWSEARNRDLAAYIFCKFNKKWRDFKRDLPSAGELEYIQLDELQAWFKQIAEVNGFPNEEQFRENAADPSKGMTIDEFLQFTGGEDPTYLEKTWKVEGEYTIFTGRRFRAADEDIEFDGDFVEDAPGCIFGYVTYNQRPGGTFELELRTP